MDTTTPLTPALARILERAGAREDAPAPTSGASGIARPDRGLGIMLWHWGKAGAGAKFTHALAGELAGVPGVSTGLCVAEDTDLATLAGTLPEVPTWRVRTFRGGKGTLLGKAAAATALMGLPRIHRDFGRILDEHGTDVALCTFQSIWDAATLPTLARMAGRFVLVLHDAKLHPGDWYPLRPTVMRRQVLAADGLVVLSDHVGRMASAMYGYPSDRIWTVPHGAFSFGDAQVAPRGLPSDRPLRLLFLGRIVAYKGLGLLVEAYREMISRGMRVDLEVMGDGDLGRNAAALATLPGVTVTNRWVDESDIAGALSRNDVVVLPYVEASQSGVAAAAMTAGLPIVATPVGGLVEQVSHGRTGIVAAGMAPGDIADAVRSLTDGATYRACSAGALARARDELGWGPIAARVAGIAAEVASRPRRVDGGWLGRRRHLA